MLMPCKMSMEVNNNYNDEVEIEIISHNKIYYYTLGPFESIAIKNIKLVYNEGVILVKTNDMLKYAGFGEYDHWFRMTHIIN
jgi:hypothetical protein